MPAHKVIHLGNMLLSLWFSFCGYSIQLYIANISMKVYYVPVFIMYNIVRIVYNIVYTGMSDIFIYSYNSKTIPTRD